jgi:hypothetical protein
LTRRKGNVKVFVGSPSLTCPAIVVGKMLEDCKGQCEVVVRNPSSGLEDACLVTDKFRRASCDKRNGFSFKATRQRLKVAEG